MNLGAVVFSVAVGAPPPQVDEPPRVLALDWSAPATCPAWRELQDRVRTLVGPDVALRGDVRAEVTRVADRFEARVELHTADGLTRRTFADPSCGAVADAIALVVAVGLDPIAVASTVGDLEGGDEPVATEPNREAEPPGPTVPEPEPAPADRPRGNEASPPEPAEPAPEPPPRDSVRPPLGAVAFAQGAASLGLLPGAGGNVGGGAALTVGLFRVELSGVYEVARRIRHPADEQVGALLSAGAGRFGGCWAPVTGPFVLPLCAALEIGAVTGRGRGLERGGSTRALWAAVVPAVRALWRPIRRLGVGLTIEAPVALTTPRFVVDDFEDDLVRLGRVSGRFGLVFEVVLAP